MIEILRNQSGVKYTLLLSYDQCEIFSYLNVSNLHGLDLLECTKCEHEYIIGWANQYPDGIRHFLFLNMLSLSQMDCIERTAAIMHETSHISCEWVFTESRWLRPDELKVLRGDEEELQITWSEREAIEVCDIIEELLNMESNHYLN